MGLKARNVSKATPGGGEPQTMTHLPLDPLLPLDEIIRRVISVALARHGSLREAAKALQIPYSTLRDKAEKYRLTSRWSKDHPARKKQRRRRRS